MCDTAYHVEQMRRHRLLQRQREALERLAIRSQSDGCNKPTLLGRPGPVPDYPHDKRRDVFGVGGYDDTPASHLTNGEMAVILEGESKTGSANTPEIYMSLRRRHRLLRDSMLNMGPMTAFADYFPPWAVRAADRGEDEECRLSSGLSAKSQLQDTGRIYLAGPSSDEAHHQSPHAGGHGAFAST